MFMSYYAPSRLPIWRQQLNSGFPVSQQPALKPIINQNINIAYPLHAAVNNQVFALTNANTINPIYVGTDTGLSFAVPNLTVAQIWRGITGSPTRLMMTGGTGQTDIAYSDNAGVTWIPRTCLPPADWGQCAYGNGTFLAVNTISAVTVRSVDNAVSFSVEANGFSAGQILFLNGFFYHFSGTFCERSATGLAGSWTRCKYDTNLDFGSNSRLTFIYNNGLWICAFGNLILISDNGLTFRSVRLPITYNPTAIVFTNFLYVFLSANVSDVLITSQDLSWFTLRMNYSPIAMPDGLASSTGVGLLRDSTGNLRVPDTTAYEVSYV